MKYLAIGPGAMGYFIYLGALSKLHTHGKLQDLEEISGSSAGSMVSFMYLISGRDIQKVLEYSLTAPIKELMKPNIKTLLKDYGLVPIRKMRRLAEDACFHFTGRKDITFSELYFNSKIKLHVSSFCVDLMRTEYFNVDRTPDMSVLDAICMSICVPLLFSAVKHNGWHYVDGGSAEAIPCAPFIQYQSSEILALKLAWSKVNSIKDLKSYGLSVMYSILSMRASYSVPIVDISTDDNDVFDFGAGDEGKLKMFLLGQSQKFLK
jgi:predicted acylesterase/phospholipase RssA